MGFGARMTAPWVVSADTVVGGCEHPGALLSSVSQFSRSVVLTLCDPWTAARQASLSITNSLSSLKLMSIESVMPSNHLILCRPLLLTLCYPASNTPPAREEEEESRHYHEG